MDVHDILETAREAIDCRGKEYDKEGKERSMQSIVAAYNAVTGQSMTEHDGWLFMMCLKAVRAHQGRGNDSYIDGAAYFALMGESNDR